MAKPLPPASEAGFEAAGQIVDEFSSDLLAEAGRIARRKDADEASARHVQAAADYLYSSATARSQQALVALGGLLAGGGAGAMTDFLVEDKINGVYVGICAAVLVFGIIFMMIGLFRR